MLHLEPSAYIDIKQDSAVDPRTKEINRKTDVLSRSKDLVRVDLPRLNT